MKRRLIRVLLVLFALWPVVQFGAVLRYGVDPWKLFAWGMYSVPGPMKTIRVATESETGALRVIDPATYSTRERQAATRFVEYSRALGQLASAEPLAHTIFEQRPEAEALILGVATLRLDRDTARLVSSLRYTRFDRKGNAEPVDPSSFD